MVLDYLAAIGIMVYGRPVINPASPFKGPNVWILIIISIKRRVVLFIRGLHQGTLGYVKYTKT